MEKIEMLNLIHAADEAYYKKSAPVMSDAEYDVLRKQFIELYGESELNYVPTDADSADFVHPHEVISLAKVKAGDDATLVAWLTKSADDGTTFMPVHLQKKLDGCTVVTYKIDGKLVVVSRGDGKQGKVLANIPAKYANALDFSSAYPVRSEAIFTKSDFDEICKEQVAQGLEPFKNIRNAVSGVLQSKERSPYLDRVTFVAYDLMGCPFNVTEKLGYIEDHTPYWVVGSRVYTSVEKVKEDLPKLFEEWSSITNSYAIIIGSGCFLTDCNITISYRRYVFTYTYRICSLKRIVRFWSRGHIISNTNAICHVQSATSRHIHSGIKRSRTIYRYLIRARIS